MLPNLLDDLLKAWDTHPPTAESPAPAASVVTGEGPLTEQPQFTAAEPAPVQIAAEPTPETIEPQVAEQPFVPAYIEPPHTLLPSDPFGTFLAGLTKSATVETSSPDIAPVAETGTVMDSLLTSLLANFDPEPTMETAAPPPAPARPTFPVALSTPIGRKFVAVAMGTHRFALPIESVLEVARCPRITFVPGLAPHVKGVFSFRGEVVPVVNIRALGGLPELEQTPAGDFYIESTRIVAVQTANGRSRAALLFDSLEGIVSIDTDAQHPRLKDTKDQYPLASTLSSVCLHDTTQFGLISIDRLLDEAGCTEGVAAH